MAGVTASIARSYTTDAEFRSVIAAFRQAFSDQGLVRTSDTGQIDPTTVVRPGTINTAAGYEIWRFNDALQATSPIFIKLEHGVGPSSTTPSWWITVGTGTDGAGTITGVIVAREQHSTTSNNAVATGTTTSYLFSSSSRMSFFYNGNSLSSSTQGYPVVLCIERGRDADGVEQGDCLIRGKAADSPGARNAFRAYWLDGGANPASSRLSLPIVSVSGGGYVTKVDGDFVVSVPIYVRPDKQRYAIGLLSGNAGDFTRGTPVAASILGQSRNVMPLLDASLFDSQDLAFSGTNVNVNTVQSVGDPQPLVLWD